MTIGGAIGVFAGLVISGVIMDGLIYTVRVLKPEPKPEVIMPGQWYTLPGIGPVHVTKVAQNTIVYQIESDGLDGVHGVLRKDFVQVARMVHPPEVPENLLTMREKA